MDCDYEQNFYLALAGNWHINEISEENKYFEISPSWMK